MRLMAMSKSEGNVGGREGLHPPVFVYGWFWWD